MRAGQGVHQGEGHRALAHRDLRGTGAGGEGGRARRAHKAQRSNGVRPELEGGGRAAKVAHRDRRRVAVNVFGRKGIRGARRSGHERRRRGEGSDLVDRARHDVHRLASGAPGHSVDPSRDQWA